MMVVFSMIMLIKQKHHAEEDEQQPVSPVAKKQKLTADAEKEQEKQDNCDGNAVNEVK